MPSEKAREAWINAYNESVSFVGKQADEVAAAEIDAAVQELVDEAHLATFTLERCGHMSQAIKLRAALEGWRIK